MVIKLGYYFILAAKI